MNFKRTFVIPGNQTHNLSIANAMIFQLSNLHVVIELFC